MLYAFERGYAGRPFVPETAFDTMRRRAEQARGRAMTVGELCDLLADALWELPDAHATATRPMVS